MPTTKQELTRATARANQAFREVRAGRALLARLRQQGKTREAVETARDLAEAEAAYAAAKVERDLLRAQAETETAENAEAQRIEANENERREIQRLTSLALQTDDPELRHQLQGEATRRAMRYGGYRAGDYANMTPEEIEMAKHMEAEAEIARRKSPEYQAELDAKRRSQIYGL